MIFGRRPVYDHYTKTIYNHEVLFIIDRFDSSQPTLSVTNGADFVIKELAKEKPLPEFIIYRDTSGEWDRIRATPDGVLIGFSLLRTNGGKKIKSESEATRVIQRILREKNHRE